MSVHINEQINTPIAKDEILGYVEVFLYGNLIRRDDLVAKYEVERVSFLNRILQPFLNKVK